MTKASLTLTDRLRQLPPAVRSTMQAARRAVKAAAPKTIREVAYGGSGSPPRSKSTMWKLVRYAARGGDGYVVGIGAFSDHVSVFFPRGCALDDGTGLVEGRGKAFRFVTLRTPADAGRPAVKRVLREAFRGSSANATAPAIDAYLGSVSPDRRAILQKLRKTIHAILPDVEECISYGMPAFRHGGRVVAGFRATGTGCSYYPFSGRTLTTLARELDVKSYGRTKSALHFDANRPLPPALVRKLLEARIAEARQRAG
jgi:uncharacterized protein YdhG (YjbR/CyaY superfamily)